ncbi:MAG TPA: IS110 family transposase [Anaerolineales bacterium]|nr:IS110 family transposase [Anaerolineales bacterium]
MTNASNASPFERYLAIDAHKHYVVVGGLNAQLEIVLPAHRMDIERYPQWAKVNLTSKDCLVIEASVNTWDLYDLTAAVAGKVVVAHPLQVKLIASARVKTDKLDVYRLARLLAGDLIPEVWVPPIPVRELRNLVAHRRRVIQLRTMTRNRLHSLAHRHNLVLPEGGAFADKNQDWWKTLKLSPVEKLRLQHDVALLEFLEPQIEAIDAELARQSNADPWKDATPYLMQLPGFGLVVVMTLLSAIGDIQRFPTSKHLVGYSGLGASLHESGETHSTGGITKQGRKELRHALVEAAWTAVSSHPYWREQYQKLSHRMAANKAIVAIARHLLVAVWYVLTERTADRRAHPDMVAYKLMMWSWKLNEVQRGGLTSRQFVRYGLMRLKIGQEISRIKRMGNRPIASVEEVLGRLPELNLKI